MTIDEVCSMTLDEICDGSLPDPGDVALNVPVGNTVGTAVLTEADVEAALTAWASAALSGTPAAGSPGALWQTSRRRPAAARRQRACIRPSAPSREEVSAPVAFPWRLSLRTRTETPWPASLPGLLPIRLGRRQLPEPSKVTRLAAWPSCSMRGSIICGECRPRTIFRTRSRSPSKARRCRSRLPTARLSRDRRAAAMRSDIEQIFGIPNVLKWALLSANDPDSTAGLAEITARINWAIGVAPSNFGNAMRPGTTDAPHHRGRGKRLRPARPWWRRWPDFCCINTRSRRNGTGRPAHS